MTDKQIMENILEVGKWYNGIDFSGLTEEKNAFGKFAIKSVYLLRQAAEQKVKVNVANEATAFINMRTEPYEVTMPAWSFQLPRLREWMTMVNSELTAKLSTMELMLASLTLVNGFFIHEGLHARHSPMSLNNLLNSAVVSKPMLGFCKSEGLNIIEDCFIEKAYKLTGKPAAKFLDMLAQLAGRNFSDVIEFAQMVIANGGHYEIEDKSDLKMFTDFVMWIIVSDWNNSLVDEYKELGLAPILDELFELAGKAYSYDKKLTIIHERKLIVTKFFEKLDSIFSFSEGMEKFMSPKGDRSSETLTGEGDQTGTISEHKEEMKRIVSKAGSFDRIDELEIEAELADRVLGEEVREASDIIEEKLECSLSRDFENRIKVVDVMKWEESDYDIDIEDIDSQVLEDILQLRQNDLMPGMAMERGYHIVSSRVHRITTDGKIFAPMVRMNPGMKAKDLPEMILLCDFSGSVSSRLAREELKATKTMYTILTDLGVPTKVLLHSSYEPAGHRELDYCLIIEVIDNQVNGEDEIDTRFKRAMKVGRGENYDGFVLKYIADHFTSPEKSTILMHFSDGCPSGSGYDYYGKGGKHTEAVLDELPKRNVEVIGVSVKSEVVRTNEFLYKEHHIDASEGLDTLAIEIHRIIQNL